MTVSQYLPQVLIRRGVVQVTDGLIQVLRNVRELKSLQLGYTRVSEEGIKGLTRFEHLAEIRFFAEDNITDAALEDLALITSLTCLSLACCGEQVRQTALCEVY